MFVSCCNDDYDYSSSAVSRAEKNELSGLFGLCDDRDGTATVRALMVATSGNVRGGIPGDGTDDRVDGRPCVTVIDDAFEEGGVASVTAALRDDEVGPVPPSI